MWVDGQNDAIESFSAYKILDVYYNKKTNEMTYGFTSAFKDFIDQIPETDELFYNLTIEKYQQLTSDITNDVGSRDIHKTNSTLNKLVSKYATYLKGKNSSDSFIKIEKIYDDIYGDVYKNTVEVGSYLILPTKVISQIENPESIMRLLYIYTYGVSVANITFRVSGGEWDLGNKYQVTSKSASGDLSNAVFNANLENIMEAIEETVSLENDITYSANKDLLNIMLINNLEYFNIPTNTHSSILNNTDIMKRIKQIEYVFPEGITLDKIYIFVDGVCNEMKIRDDAIYYVDNGEKKYADFIEKSETNSIIFENILLTHDRPLIIFKLNVNDKIELGTINYGNTITTNAYYLKDAYVDISGMSQEEVEEAVVGVGTLTNTVYTYGVKVTNKDNSTLLNGAKFQVYADEGCTEKVGEEFELTENGTYTFKGLNDTDTYYLKQTKASTGYKMASTITLSPTSLNKETGYYDVEVTSAKMGLLPTTGGLGTILYTTFGLLIIVVGSIFFISYRKRQVNN